MAHTLLSHIREPLAPLGETARVPRPGGAVAIFDGDYASLTFGCSDPELGQAMEPALQSTIMSVPRVLRDLPRLLPQAGLRLVSTQAHVYAEAASSRFLLSLAETYGRRRRALYRPPRSSGGSPTSAARQRREPSFGACNYYAYVARR